MFGSKVYVVFSFDKEDPDWAEIAFIGNSREECLRWWNLNWRDYTDKDEDDSWDINWDNDAGNGAEKPIPEFVDNRWIADSTVYGLTIKEMELI